MLKQLSTSDYKFTNTYLLYEYNSIIAQNKSTRTVWFSHKQLVFTLTYVVYILFTTTVILIFIIRILYYYAY